MTKRKILYGYKIKDGELRIYEDEAVVVRRGFTTYLTGLSYQRLADSLNADHIPFCQEAPIWNKHKVKRMLEDPRYTGSDGYPQIVDAETFQQVQAKILGKNMCLAEDPGDFPLTVDLSVLFLDLLFGFQDVQRLLDCCGGVLVDLHHLAHSSLTKTHRVGQLLSGINRRKRFRQCCRKRSFV